MTGAPLQVLHVCDFAAPYPGAFIRQLRMLDEELVARGAAPTAFAFPLRAIGAGWLDDLRAAGHDVTLLPEPRARGGADLADAIVEVATRTGADVIHSHFGTYDIACAAAVRALRGPHGRIAADGLELPRLVWHYRTALEVPVDQRSPTRRVKDWLKYVRAGGQADLAIGVTAALAAEVAARGFGDRARAVVAGCDTDTFRPNPVVRARVRQELGIADDQVFVLHMGWHWHRKGGDLLAEAARMLERRGRTELVFCSVGAPVDEVEAPVRRLEPTDRIHELHQASDLFVSASRSEGFGNGLVEAMACERVAVAALVDGQREVFDGVRGVVSVEPGSARTLADGIERMLASREAWATHGATNRERVVARHSMRRWAREMADTYASLGLPLAPAAGQSAGEEDGEVRSA